MHLGSAREGVGIAIDALRSNKVRAALTILGIVIGVATTMAMASIIAGIRSGVTAELDALGPENFIVSRFDQTEIRFEDVGGEEPWEGKPSITLAEAELLQSLPSVHTVTVSVNTSADLKHEDESFTGMSTLGRGADWSTYSVGDFLRGRNFLPSDVERSAPVAVLSADLATEVFGAADPTGQTIRLGGEQLQVIGVYRQQPSLFSELNKNWIVVPYTTALKRLDADDEWMELLVVPRAGVSQEQAMDDATAALRSSRGLRPDEENDFALVRQEALSNLFDKMTRTFFIVMLVLSSIGLLVGGVGVVAIMMISVTERTREIGVRKALGATRREILWQFLVESMTVTVIGGAIGILIGGGGAILLSSFTPIDASVPLWSILAALGVSAISGIGFGLYPANKAARLDPVEALRYE